MKKEIQHYQPYWGKKKTECVSVSIREAFKNERMRERKKPAGICTSIENKVLTWSPRLSPEQDLSPGMNSLFKHVALKEKLNSSGTFKSSSSTLDRSFCPRKNSIWCKWALISWISLNAEIRRKIIAVVSVGVVN